MFGGMFIVMLNTQIIFPELLVRDFMDTETNFFILVPTIVRRPQSQKFKDGNNWNL